MVKALSLKGTEPPLLVTQEGDGLPLELRFKTVWEDYPRKTHRKDAEDTWKKLTFAQKKLAATALPRHYRAWRQEGRSPDKIPALKTWLHGRCWEDVLNIGPSFTEEYGDEPLPVRLARENAEHNKIIELEREERKRNAWG